MTDEQRIGDHYIQVTNLILDSLERHRVLVLNQGTCAACGQSPCACGKGTMAEVEA